MTPAGQEYQRLWDELDALWDDGQGESPQADALRSKMNPLWYAMTTTDLEEFKTHAQSKDQVAAPLTN